MTKFTGTFEYDQDNGKLTLHRNGGSKMPPVRIVLLGSDEAHVTSTETGKCKQYREVILWQNDAGAFDIATAIPAPIDRTLRIGKWTAGLLAMFSGLSRLEHRLFDWYRGNRHQNHPADDCYQNADYHYPPRAAFMPEFVAYWRIFRYHAIRGWLFLFGMAIGVSIMTLLF